MIEGYGAVTQALLGTLLTWGLTAVGAGCVFFIRGKHVSEIFFENFDLVLASSKSNCGYIY